MMRLRNAFVILGEFKIEKISDQVSFSEMNTHTHQINQLINQSINQLSKAQSAISPAKIFCVQSGIERRVFPISLTMSDRWDAERLI